MAKSDFMSNIGKNISGQWAKTKKAAVNVAKSVNDALVPGKGKATDIVNEPAKFRKAIKGKGKT